MPAASAPSRTSLLWGMLATLAVLALTVGVFFQHYLGQQKLIAEQHLMALDVAYRATIETYRLDAATHYRLNILQPAVLDLVEAALATPEERMPVLRGRLYRLLKPVYDELRDEGLRQFHFHLADGRSLLRFHLPQKAGDRLFELRPSVRIANQERRPVSGLEVGRTLPGFRYVFPLAREGRHLGSVELTLPFERIEENLARLLAYGDFALLLNKAAIFAKVDAESREKFAEAPLHPEFLIENPTISRVTRNLEQSATARMLAPLLRADALVQERMRAGESFVVPLIHDGRGYTATFLALPNVEGQPVAYIARFAATDALRALRNGLLRQGALAALLVLALMLALQRLRRQRGLLRADVARREQAEAGLRLYENIFVNSREAILVTDRDNRIVTVNPAFCELTGYAAAEVRGQDPRMLGSGQTPREVYQALWAALLATGHWQGELTDRRKDGTTYPKWVSISAIRDDDGAIANYIASFVDISERKAAEARIERLAHHDALTGLLNRYSLEDRLAQSLLAARRQRQRVAVMFIDLDRFKAINDGLGHPVGDRLLQEVARRLQSCVRESDIVARQGGDEFVVVLNGLEATQDAAPVTYKLMRALRQDYALDGLVLHTTPSIGIAMYPHDGETVEVLLKNADTAMYHAKEKGRNNLQFFTAAMTAAATERLAIEHDLHAALAGRQFALHYQPQVWAADGRICGVEALLRWQHPARGMVPPDRFIPIAEEAGLIEAIGAWALDEACRQLAAWRAQGIDGLRMAVNLSAHQLRSQQLVGLVDGCMARHGITAGELELEITESVAMQDPERAIGQMRALRDLGVHLAIDDFGTGYSSLAYLKHLPIQILKLDRSFVRDIEVDANDAAISAATVALAHTLGLRVVAEGVETAAQAEFLGRVHGCDILQGYLFGRPAPAAAVGELLQRRRLGAGLSPADCLPQGL